MCGIAGFVNAQGRPADPDIATRMTATLRHRGPDGSGVHLEGPVALGHRRLSIIDVEGGAQPMSNEDDSIWVSFNGEIYNDLSLRAELVAAGHRFRNESDTEGLVHLYEQHGDAFPSRLNGMFALAIWDGRRRRLLLTRDRMGQKPLFYAELPGGGLAFASEPKAILAHPEFVGRLDPAGLARYLFYEYIPGPDSIWLGMKKLLPGHTLVWDNGVVAIERYWTPPVPVETGESFEAASERFWGEFVEAVGRHRRSDVPLGVFLSGGVDSSSVAAALCEWEPAAKIRTFSIGFDDPSFDESGHARAVASLLGTDHRERTFSADDLLRLLPEVANWLDEPFGDASILPTHLLSRFAREEVTVALGGDGADELLAGYPTFKAENASLVYGRLPRVARKLAEAAVGLMPVDHQNMSLDFKLKQFLRGAGEPTPLAHQRWLGSFSGAEIRTLLVDPGAIDVEAGHLGRASRVAPGLDRLTQSLRLYQESYLPDDILAKVDRASMACSLEVRAPFLDARLVDSIQAMPAVFKYARGQTKRLLKHAARRRLPATILDRPKKGFGIPVARWLRGPLGPMLDSLLGRDRIRAQGLFDADEVARRIQEHRDGVRDHRKPLWTLLMFQLWHDRWLG
jgi:asparagine synthase (glutamine-hydrolysing)